MITYTLLASEGDGTDRTFVKFNQAVILPMSSEMLGAGEDLPARLENDEGGL